MSYGFGFLIESLVAVLLLVTIGYCVMLNKRLKRLKADEQSLKATISELITATEIAERAVAGLKATAHECDAHARRAAARRAERFCARLERQIKAGEDLLERLDRASSPPRGRARRRAEPPRRRPIRRRWRPRRRPSPSAPATAPEPARRMIRCPSRDFRLVPVVLFATICLFALKALGLVFDGGYSSSTMLVASDPATWTSPARSRRPSRRSPTRSPARRSSRRRSRRRSPGRRKCSTSNGGRQSTELAPRSRCSPLDADRR